MRLPGTGAQLYVLPRALAGDDRALVLLSQIGCQGLENPDATVVQVVQVRNGTPRAGRKVVVPGQLLESRLVGDVLYLVTDAWISIPNRNQAGVIMSWSSHQEVRIASINLARPDAPNPGVPVVLPGKADAVHATDRRLFVAMVGYGIKVFDITDASGRLRDGGYVRTAGRVTDKFKIHEQGDVLSVVSQEISTLQSDLETWSLARPGSPRPLARLPIGAGENLFATRFDGSRLYVVTFRRVDLDLCGAIPLSIL